MNNAPRNNYGKRADTEEENEKHNSGSKDDQQEYKKIEILHSVE